MAIFPQTAAMILKEHKHRPIAGDVLLIGRQTVLLTVDSARALIAREGVKMKNGFLTEIDRSTVGAEQARYITDRSFFSMFSDAKVMALDVSDYEDRRSCTISMHRTRRTTRKLPISSSTAVASIIYSIPPPP
jgi:hypothetical protein